jgi:hypothetical protein
LEIEGKRHPGKRAINSGYHAFWRQLTIIEGPKGAKETIREHLVGLKVIELACFARFEHIKLRAPNNPIAFYKKLRTNGLLDVRAGLVQAWVE